MNRFVALILSIVFLLTPLEARRRWVPNIASGGVALLIDEGFETSGHTTPPSNWFRGGASDFAYIPALIQTQSLGCNAATSDFALYQSGAALNHSEVWFKITVQINTLPSSFAYMLQLQDGSFNIQYSVFSISDGTLVVQDASGAIFAQTSGAMSGATAYDIYGHYKAGSGANAQCDVGFVTQGGSRPTSGANYASGAIGTSTANAQALELTGITNGIVVVFDGVKVSAVGFPP